ncbi:MAG: HEAT repeat domain-containing protein [Treponema sp.]|nr:HEAT repeat domain-containing protein [Treponema sp.]
MNKRPVVISIILLLVSFTLLNAQAPEPATTAAEERQSGDLSPLDEQRLQIIRFGTDTEIANLIKILRNEQPSTPADTSVPESRLERELLEVAKKTKNRAILTGVFGYFGDRTIGGLEERARTAIEERDYEAGETVNAALQYLGNIKASGVRPLLSDIINGEESRFISGAIRALGLTAEKDGPGETAEYLIEYYSNRDPGDENKRLVIVALGDIKAKEGTALLVSIAENEDEKAPLRMAALEALSKIADPAGLNAIISAVNSKDPNVRSAAVGALGPFTGADADAAIVEAFRDSYYRTRIAAAKAAGERKLVSAVPYLRFRAENDEVPNVRDEAVKAMGLIGGNEAEAILKDLFKERKNSDRIRINASEMLLTYGKNDYVTDVIVEMEEAQSKKQTTLYNGFLRILGSAKSPKLEDLARRLFANSGVIEKSYALDICLNNNFRSLADEIRKLTDPKNGSLSNKSRALLERWGLPLTAPASPAEAPSPSEESIPD